MTLLFFPPPFSRNIHLPQGKIVIVETLKYNIAFESQKSVLKWLPETIVWEEKKLFLCSKLLKDSEWSLSPINTGLGKIDEGSDFSEKSISEHEEDNQKGRERNLDTKTYLKKKSLSSTTAKV